MNIADPIPPRLIQALGRGLVAIGVVVMSGCSGMVVQERNVRLPANFMAGAQHRTGGDADRAATAGEGSDGKPSLARWRDGAGQLSESLESVVRAVRPRHELDSLLAAANDVTACQNDADDRKHPYLCDYGHELEVLGLGAEQVISAAGPAATLGIALSGGGSRAGFFALGALKALHAEGVLNRAHYLSTVSGGGYAAYWYYTQLSQNGDWTNPAANPFYDCFPNVGDGLYPSFDPGKAVSDGPAIVDCARADAAVDGKPTLDRPHPAQAYLSNHTDLLARSDGQFRNHVPEYVVKIYPFLGGVIYPLWPSHPSGWLPGFLTTVPHHVANTLFDWSWNGSFYGAYYRASIHRAWGSVGGREVPNCHVELGDLGRRLESAPTVAASCLFFSRTHLASDAPGATDNAAQSLTERTRRYWRSAREAASAVKTDQPYPIWIVNTMGLPSHSIWTACSDKIAHELRLHNYEFTPFGHGSGLFGYFLRTDHIKEGRKGPMPRLIFPHELDVAQVVHASGAAFDSSAVASLALRCTIRIAEQLGNFALALRVANPVFDDAERALHAALPWPLYYLHGERDSPRNSEIYLTDGGHIDNLGLYSLIRRRTGTILAFDSTHDPDGGFSDLRTTSSRLAKEGVGIRLEGLCEGGADRGVSPCAHRESYAAYDPRNAVQSVFVGKYFRLDEQRSAADSPMIGRVVYVKSSVPHGSLENRECDKASESRIPCTTLALLTQPGKEGGTLSGYFPNHSTPGIVFESNRQTFWAYRDLAYFLAKQGIRVARTHGMLANPR